jgi:hypothetical protein
VCILSLPAQRSGSAGRATNGSDQGAAGSSTTLSSDRGTPSSTEGRPRAIPAPSRIPPRHKRQKLREQGSHGRPGAILPIYAKHPAPVAALPPATQHFNCWCQRRIVHGRASVTRPRDYTLRSSFHTPTSTPAGRQPFSGVLDAPIDEEAGVRIVAVLQPQLFHLLDPALDLGGSGSSRYRSADEHDGSPSAGGRSATTSPGASPVSGDTGPRRPGRAGRGESGFDSRIRR